MQYWNAQNPKVAGRLLQIMRETLTDPFGGIGKPEALKHDLRGCWSRRLTDEDRVVYRVTDAAIEFVQGRYHY